MGSKGLKNLRVLIALALAVVFALFLMGGCGDPVAAGETVSGVPSQSSSSGAGADTGNDPDDSGGTDPDALICTISISCETILSNIELCDPAKKDIIPADGWVLRPAEIAFSEGESVFDVLKRVCRENSIHMEFSMAPAYNNAYIEGIANIYEFDVGELSGWMYEVNGWFPNYGCSAYELRDGDVIKWVYTCDLGSDVGGSFSEQAEH